MEFLNKSMDLVLHHYRCSNGNNQPVNPKFDLALMDDIFVNVVSKTIIRMNEKS